MAVLVFGSLLACSRPAPETADDVGAADDADRSDAPVQRAPTVLDDQLKALDKARAVEATLQKEQANRDKAIEDAGG
jgi:hypothetical protein